MVDRRAQLIAVLCGIGGDTTQAEFIHLAMLDVAVEATGEGREIGVDVVYYERPRKKAAGPARDLRDLARVGRKVIAGKLHWHAWVTAWAKLPEKTRQLIWRPKLIQTKRGRTLDRKELLGFSASRFVMVAPKPEIAMPGVKAALQRIKAIPGSKRRQPNQAEDRARATIWRAFQAGSIRGGVRSRPFLEFASTIDRIYEADLFDVKDGRHLRRLAHTVGYKGPRT